MVCRVIQSGFQSDCPRVNREPSFPNARKPRKAGRGLGTRLPCMRDIESDPRLGLACDTNAGCWTLPFANEGLQTSGQTEG